MQHSRCEIKREKDHVPCLSTSWSCSICPELSWCFGLATKVTVQRQQPGAENQKRQVRPTLAYLVSHADGLYNVDNTRCRVWDKTLCQGQTCSVAVDYCFNLSLLKLIS